MIAEFFLAAAYTAAVLDELGQWAQGHRRVNMSRPIFKIELGSTVEDRDTGYRGVVHGRIDWIGGHRRYVVQSQEIVNGLPIAAESFAEEALQLIKPPGA